MLRQVLIQIALFLAPFAAYGALLKMRGRPVGVGDSWSEAPLGWLFLGGLILTAAGLGGPAPDTDKAGPGRYVPAHLETGARVPGRFEP